MNNLVFQERQNDGTLGHIKDLSTGFDSLLWQVENDLVIQTWCSILYSAVLFYKGGLTSPTCAFFPPSIHWCQWKINKVVKAIGTDAMKKAGFCKLNTGANNVIAVVLQLLRFNGLHLISKGLYLTFFIKLLWKK